MNGKILIVASVALLVSSLAWFLHRQGATDKDASLPDREEGAPLVEIVLPATLSTEAQIGKRGFVANCADCHGVNATGREGLGPPLIHKIYEPGHHADMAFQLAVQNGVRSHHWSFGDMPPVEGLTPADVASIVTYVREVQRENGID